MTPSRAVFRSKAETLAKVGNDLGKAAVAPRIASKVSAMRMVSRVNQAGGVRPRESGLGWSVVVGASVMRSRDARVRERGQPENLFLGGLNRRKLADQSPFAHHQNAIRQGQHLRQF